MENRSGLGFELHVSFSSLPGLAGTVVVLVDNISHACMFARWRHNDYVIDELGLHVRVQWLRLEMPKSLLFDVGSLASHVRIKFFASMSPAIHYTLYPNES